MKLAAVDCNSKKALTTCKKFGIEEIPTVKVRPGRLILEPLAPKIPMLLLYSLPCHPSQLKEPCTQFG